MKRGPWILMGFMGIVIALLSVAYITKGTSSSSRRTQVIDVPFSLRGAGSAPVGRVLDLMKALKAHDYRAACDVYHPSFWSMTGYLSSRCAEVLRESFPKSEPVAYRFELGGRVGRRGAIVVVSMVLGENAALCERLWSKHEGCPRSSPFYFDLTLDVLVEDWQLKRIVKPHDRWYVFGVGAV